MFLRLFFFLIKKTFDQLPNEKNKSSCILRMLFWIPVPFVFVVSRPSDFPSLSLSLSVFILCCEDFSPDDRGSDTLEEEKAK